MRAQCLGFPGWQLEHTEQGVLPKSGDVGRKQISEANSGESDGWRAPGKQSAQPQEDAPELSQAKGLRKACGQMKAEPLGFIHKPLVTALG